MDEMPEMTPEMLQQLMEMGVMPDQLDDIKQQMATAQGIRDREGPQGRGMGRIYQAANPLEHIADFMQKRKAAGEIKDLEGQRGDIYGKQSAGRGMFARMLMDTQGNREKEVGGMPGGMQSPDISANVPMPNQQIGPPPGGPPPPGAPPPAGPPGPPPSMAGGPGPGMHQAAPPGMGGAPPMGPPPMSPAVPPPSMITPGGRGQGHGNPMVQKLMAMLIRRGQ